MSRILIDLISLEDAMEILGDWCEAVPNATDANFLKELFVEGERCKLITDFYNTSAKILHESPLVSGEWVTVCSYNTDFARVAEWHHKLVKLTEGRKQRF
jgi:hypothetical protein